MQKNTFSKRKILSFVVLLPLIWFLVWVILYPAINSIRLSVGLDQGGFTWQYFKEFFFYQKNIIAYRNTLVLAVSTVLVCGIIGTTFAFIITRFRFFGRGFFDIVLLIPMMVPGVLFTIAFMQIYGQTGFLPQLIKQWFHLDRAPNILSGFPGIMFVHATTQYLVFYVMVSAALKKIDASVYEAARSLGASKIKIFFTITLPLLTPALVGASVLTFMSGVGSFAAPSLIGGNFKVMSVQMLMTKTNGFYNLVSVQGLMLALMSILFLVIMRFYETRRNYIVDVKGKPIEPIVVKGFGKNTLIFLLMSIAPIIILLPVFMIFFLSFVPRGALAVDIFPKTFDLSNYIEFFNRKRIFTPFLNSLRMSAIGISIATCIGALSSYIIVKTKGKIKYFIELMVLLPWALPASTVGINMILAFNQPTLFAFGKVLVGTAVIMPLTYSVTRLTLIVRSTSASLYQLHNSLEESSRSLGATWLQTFVKVVLPIIMPGILAGAMLGFVALVGDYRLSVLMYTTSTMPVSVAMTNAMNDFNIGLSMVYGVFLILITITIITTAKKVKSVGDFTF